MDTGPDQITVSVAGAVPFIMMAVRKIRKYRHCTSRDKFVTDLLNGVTITPFFMMLGSAFSEAVMKELVETNRVLIAVAGAIGVVAVIAELMKAES